MKGQPAAALTAKGTIGKKTSIEANVSVAASKAETVIAKSTVAPKSKGKLDKKNAIKSTVPNTKDIDVTASTPPVKNAIAGAASPPSKKSKTASPSPSPTTTAKAKAVAVVEVMAIKKKSAARAVAINGKCTLGCTKCRHSWRGCGQCRDPAFTGFRWNPFCEM